MNTFERVLGDSTVAGVAMNAYEPLRRYLEEQDDEQVTLCFDELTDIVGHSLPKAARDAGWWTNDPDHAEAKAWMDAGYHVAFISLASQSVTFIRVFACVS